MDPASDIAPTGQAPRLDVRRPVALSLLALAIGLAVEELLYGRPIGISLPLWTLACLGAAVVAARLEGVRPSGSAWLLGLGALALSLIVSARLEPMTVFLGFVLTLLSLALFVRLFRFGRFGGLGWIDAAIGFGWVPLEAWYRPWAVAGEAWRRSVRERGRRKVLFSVGRGLLLGLPILVVFVSLLSAADVVFSDYVAALLRWINLEQLLDWSARGLVIAAGAVFGLGALVSAVRDPGNRSLIGWPDPLVRAFLGFTEAAIVLGMVMAVFGAFVIVQFTYLFGGEANIHAAGYTYAEYARRGFGELVAVAVLALGMIYTLAQTTRRESRSIRSVFFGLCLGIVLLVGVMLVSAYQRLVLYEMAYGFSRLRAYTHIAIGWLAVSFLVFLVLLGLRRLRGLAPAALLMASGFGLTLAGLDVDAFIVEQNAGRYLVTGDLDQAYLSSLSHDAVPGLARLALRLEGPERESLLADLACRRRALLREQARLGWPSLHASRIRALEALGRLEPELEPYRVYRVSGGFTDERWPSYVVRVSEGFRGCRSSWV